MIINIYIFIFIKENYVNICMCYINYCYVSNVHLETLLKDETKTYFFFEQF